MNLDPAVLKVLILLLIIATLVQKVALQLFGLTLLRSWYIVVQPSDVEEVLLVGLLYRMLVRESPLDSANRLWMMCKYYCLNKMNCTYTLLSI